MTKALETTKALEKLEAAGVLAGGGQGKVRSVRDGQSVHEIGHAPDLAKAGEGAF
ncbi:hypothetical protein [Streptomyces lavendofoliae]|uniref:hypothetical protein n=1 Tax=Streptomyces lavendofoliae TaxID=67314 RepID=UPI00300EEDB1